MYGLGPNSGHDFLRSDSTHASIAATLYANEHVKHT
jgi:hypothetical protein